MSNTIEQPILQPSIIDDFSVAQLSGQVIGTQSSNGQIRQGIDVEKTISIDNGALRFRPLISPGWQRAGVAYGPYQRQAGLTLSVFMLNGHHASEGNDIGETLKGRFFRWLRGSGTYPIGSRLIRWTLSSHHRNRIELFYRWLRNRKGRFADGHLLENLAVGWFPEAYPQDPTEAGNAIVIQASEAENGALCVRMGDRTTATVKGLQNLQAYYVVVLREEGAAYYAASVAGARGLAAYPYMRLVGIDAFSDDKTVFAGIHQGALGQVGFRVDSRVYGVRAEVLPALSAWYGTAQAADTLVGNAGLDQSAAEIGGTWRVLQGEFERTEKGLIGRRAYNVALLEMSEPAGAVHVMVSAGEILGEEVPDFAVLWRVQDEDNAWGLWFCDGDCYLRRCENGVWSQIAQEKRYGLKAGMNAVQILDTGESFSLYLNGDGLFEDQSVQSEFNAEKKIGLIVHSSGSDEETVLSFQNIEAHPRNILMPEQMRSGEPWCAEGNEVAIADSFSINPQHTRQDLAGRRSDVGDQPWRKEIGRGRMLLTDAKAVKVEASSSEPNKGRLAYTVAWPNPRLADISVDILPPGTARHQKEKGRGGVIFWQDQNHYLILNQWLDDTFAGSAVSAFFQIDGFEEIYDAVWSNLGDRVAWGVKHQFRVVFDGLNFMAYIDGEPVLYRSLEDIYPTLAPLKINRVGIVANWEWGDDTGTTFSQFVGKV